MKLTTYLHLVLRLRVNGAHAPVQWVLGILSLRVNQPVCEVNHLPPSSADIKSEWSPCSCSVGTGDSFLGGKSAIVLN